MDGWMGRRIGGQTDGWVDGWMDGWTHGWMDEREGGSVLDIMHDRSRTTTDHRIPNAETGHVESSPTRQDIGCTKREAP